MRDTVPAAQRGILAGQVAVYLGASAAVDAGQGHVLVPDVRLSGCEKTARNLHALGRPDLVITAPTYFSDGGGCC